MYMFTITQVEQQAMCKVQPTQTEMVSNTLNASCVKSAKWNLARCSVKLFN